MSDNKKKLIRLLLLELILAIVSMMVFSTDNLES